MELPFKDLLQLSRDHTQIWPPDLVKDLEEEEPLVSLQSQTFSQLISEHLKPQNTSQVKTNNDLDKLPTLVVSGWNTPRTKGTKNWSDFENLILFYTIGKLAIANTPKNIQQKEVLI